MSALGHEPDDPFAVACDANSPAPLHLIEKLREFRFGV
jgi:hypothetical protein